MTELLTTRQVQALLHVDRTTIYRMVESGELPALRVGKQWRFARGQVEAWLQARQAPGPQAAPPAPDAAAVQATSRYLPAASPAIEPPVLPTSSGLRELLAMSGTQLIQDAFADALGVMIVITDMDGRPVTRISNPSPFFRALAARSAGAVGQCVATWQQLANGPALEPRWALNEMGLLCTRALIRVGSELQGMVMLGGLAPEDWPPPAEQIAALARQFAAEPPVVAAQVNAVHRLDEAGMARALRAVQRIADVLAHLIEDRRKAE
ncbi:MAG: Helix-turn-helix domain protein [Chloroflexi bacterium ADurb.Bin325]|nr:MAG: Helix-turn-helix domain protein [Chloroflexi bacterium ADurb.Bin325]